MEIDSYDSRRLPTSSGDETALTREPEEWVIGAVFIILHRLGDPTQRIMVGGVSQSPIAFVITNQGLRAEPLHDASPRAAAIQAKRIGFGALMQVQSYDSWFMDLIRCAAFSRSSARILAIISQ